MLDKNNSAESPKAVAPQPTKITVCTSDAGVVEGVFSSYELALAWAREHQMGIPNLREGVLDSCLRERHYAVPVEAEAPRVEGELPPRPKLQGGDYRPHYRQDQTDAYISALERIVKNSHGGAFLVEDLKKGLPELSLLAEEEEN